MRNRRIGIVFSSSVLAALLAIGAVAVPAFAAGAELPAAPAGAATTTAAPALAQTVVQPDKGITWADIQISIREKTLRTNISVQIAPDPKKKDVKVTYTFNVTGPKTTNLPAEVRTYAPGLLFSDDSIFSLPVGGFPDGEYMAKFTVKDQYGNEKSIERPFNLGSAPTPPVKHSALVFYEGSEEVNMLVTASMSLVLNFEQGPGLVYRGTIEIKPIGKVEFGGLPKIVALGQVQAGPDFIVERPLIQQIDPAAIKLTGTIENGNPEKIVDEIYITTVAEYPPAGPNQPNRLETKRIRLYRNKDK